MRRIFVLIFSSLFIPCIVDAQLLASYADSIRRAHNIPGICYAVVSVDTLLDIYACGSRRGDISMPVTVYDRFRIGSNTKTITALIAARLVKQGKLAWNTRFFDLYPELKANSRKEYLGITLEQLLSFRAGTIKWTYTDTAPLQNQIAGNTAGEQRYNFAVWTLQQGRVQTPLSFSNPGYTLAGLMLEKAGGKTYEQLVQDLAYDMGISLGLGAPNMLDTLQPWGHDDERMPEPPAENYKLNWLTSAGNLNISVTDYAKYLRIQLRGLKNGWDILSAADFRYMHTCKKDFSLGWFWNNDLQHPVSFHAGNPGTFQSYVYIDAHAGMAFVLLANMQSPRVEEAFDALSEKIRKTWIK